MNLWGTMGLKDTALLRNNTCFYSPLFCSQVPQGVPLELVFWDLMGKCISTLSVHFMILPCLLCPKCPSPFSGQNLTLNLSCWPLPIIRVQDPNQTHCLLSLTRNAATSGTQTFRMLPLTIIICFLSPHCLEAALSSSVTSCCPYPAPPAAWSHAHHPFRLSHFPALHCRLGLCYFPPSFLFLEKELPSFLHSLFPNSFIEL